jgi:aminoglycoside 3-N-acetyltransferase
MITYRSLTQAFAQIGVQPEGVLLAHVDDDFAAQVVGGADSVLGALLACSHGLLLPAFTRRCEVVPSVGPPDNGIDYAAQPELSLQAEFFRADLVPDPGQATVAEALRPKPGAVRSSHPLLSFLGWQVEDLLAAQSLQTPLAPLAQLAVTDGDILLLGAGHRHSTAIHYAEGLAGRRTFVRWALTPAGVRECPGMPGCSEGFEALDERLNGIDRRLELDGRPLRLLPLRDLVHVVVGWIRQDPRALLCSRAGCAMCSAVRSSVRAEVGRS